MKSITKKRLLKAWGAERRLWKKKTGQIIEALTTLASYGIKTAQNLDHDISPQEKDRLYLEMSYLGIPPTIEGELQVIKMSERLRVLSEHHSRYTRSLFELQDVT